MLCRHGWQCLRTMRLFGTPIDNNYCGGSKCLESRGPVTGDAAYLNVEEITGAPEAGCSLPLLRAVENALGRIRDGSFSNARRWLVSARCLETGSISGL